jgi:hypothetical protein
MWHSRDPTLGLVDDRRRPDAEAWPRKSSRANFSSVADVRLKCTPALFLSSF